MQNTVTTAAQSISLAEDLKIQYPSLNDEKILRYVNAIERAENFPVFTDGTTPIPVAVGHITHYTDAAGNERVMINLAAKTLKCYGESRANERRMPMANASISQPAEWKCKWQQGDYVVAFIQDAEVKKLLPSTTLNGRLVTSGNREVAAVAAQALHGDQVMNVDPETGEATPAKAPKASKVSVADAPEDDLPF
ncbi:hypothetical protein [Adhaeribacter aquaticus]|uniref:hypothetical protein n=1 Tax=Adhaeribacter aquaticus TaxID=299567 RepID=UPI0004181AE3|nr:hypothetical protein [Adhaeribacter aquaticus]